MDPNNIDPADFWTHLRLVEFHPRQPEYWEDWEPFTMPVDAASDAEAIAKAEAAVASLLPKLAHQVYGRIALTDIIRPAP